MKNIGKAKVDVAEFIQLEKDKTIRIPINCGFGGHIAEAMLTVRYKAKVLCTQLYISFFARDSK